TSYVTRRPARRLSRSQVIRVIRDVVAWVVSAVLIMPLIWMLITSFKPDRETYAFPPTFLPSRLTLAGYQELLTQTSFPSWILHSFIVASIVTLAVIVLSLAASYHWYVFASPAPSGWRGSPSPRTQCRRSCWSYRSSRCS